MDKYMKVKQASAELPPNELRVRVDGPQGAYLRRAIELYANKEDKVVIKGVGKAIESALKLAELIKHR